MDRDTAYNQGLIKYEMESPCKKGHFGYRYTSTGQCCECLKQNQAKFRLEFSEVKNAAKVGEIVVKIRINLADEAALKAYADALRIQRDIITTKELQQQVETMRIGFLPESHST